MSQTDQSYAVSADELRQFIERFETLENERKDIGAKISDLLAEAKGRGFDAKAMKTIINIRKRNADDVVHEEAILETYKAALGML